jgi:hypothetical protein
VEQTPVIPPQGFRHAVDLLLKNSARTFRTNLEEVARDLVALGEDMKAAPEFAGWVIAEFERVLQRPAPALLRQLGQTLPRDVERCDLFLLYVPEDRLPVAAPVAVELTKRRIAVAFSDYEVENELQFASAIARGLNANLGGAVLQTPNLLRRGWHPPEPNSRLMILDRIVAPAVQAEELAAWVRRV